MTVFQDKANLIWEVADLLRGDYKQSDYGKVILPMTILRRLDCVLAKTKDKVLAYLPKIEKLSDSSKDVTLNKIAGENFHNRSQFDFAKLVADPNNIAMGSWYRKPLRSILSGRCFPMYLMLGLMRRKPRRVMKLISLSIFMSLSLCEV